MQDSRIDQLLGVVREGILSAETRDDGEAGKLMSAQAMIKTCQKSPDYQFKVEVLLAAAAVLISAASDNSLDIRDEIE